MFKRKPKVIVLGIVGRSPAGLLETTDLELVRFFIEINKLEIPTGNPMIINFSENLRADNAKYLDKERAKPLINID